MVARVKQPRKTIGALTCLDQWQHGGNVYKGCTNEVPDPEGNDGEWCKTTAPRQDGKDFDKCDDKLDTDSLRSNINRESKDEILIQT